MVSDVDAVRRRDVIDVATIGVGEVIWRAIRPWRRLKIARNKRRKRLGKPLLEITEEDDKMFPQGTMVKSGAIIAVIGPIVALLLQLLGVGECTPEQAAAGCIGASVIGEALTTTIGGGITVAGGVVAWKGRNRVEKRLVALEKADGTN